MANSLVSGILNFIKSTIKNNSTNQQNWKVWFEESGRSGKLGFRGEGSSFDMYWEFGGDDVVAIIDIPTEGNWDKQTGIPLEKRLPILNFIGSETIRQKISSNGHFKIEGNSILIYA